MSNSKSFNSNTSSISMNLERSRVLWVAFFFFFKLQKSQQHLFKAGPPSASPQQQPVPPAAAAPVARGRSPHKPTSSSIADRLENVLGEPAPSTRGAGRWDRLGPPTVGMASVGLGGEWGAGWKWDEIGCRVEMGWSWVQARNGMDLGTGWNWVQDGIGCRLEKKWVIRSAIGVRLKYQGLMLMEGVVG